MKKNKKTKTITFRLSKDELKSLNNYIKAYKIKKSEYIRNLILSDIFDPK